MGGITVKCVHIEKTGQHKFTPAGSAILQPAPGAIQPVVFGMCECGFSIGTLPYIEGATPIEDADEPQQDNKRILKPFGKGGRS